MFLTPWLQALGFRRTRRQKRRTSHYTATPKLTAATEALEDRTLLSYDAAFAFQIGSSMDDYGIAMAADSAGNIYVTGQYRDTADFDPDGGQTVNLTSAGSFSAYVAKYTSSGELVWARDVGGASGTATGAEVSVDDGGNVYVTGGFTGTVDFDPSAGGTFNMTSTGTLFEGNNTFVMKVDAAGDFEWARQFTASRSIGEGIRIGTDGAVYNYGWYWGAMDADPTATHPDDDDLLGNAGSQDIYAVKLTATGDLVWAGGIGGSAQDSATGMDLDANDNLLITGFFRNTVDFDPDPGATTNLTSNGSSDTFVAQYNSDGEFQWARSWGDSVHDANIRDHGTGIAADADGNVFTTGLYENTVDFDQTMTHAGDPDIVTSSGGSDLFVTKHDASGNFQWVRSMGGTGADTGAAQVGVDYGGLVYVTGGFQGAGDFDQTATYGDNRDLLTNAGSSDVFLAALDPTGDFREVYGMGGSGSDVGSGIVVDPDRNIFLAGYFASSPADFDPGAGTLNLSSNGAIDAFVMRLDDNSLDVTGTADGGTGSLRQAIINANGRAGADTISLPAGDYTLTISGTGEDAAATGDLDITDDLTIVGAGADVTTIDADGLDRVFDVFAGVTLNLEGVTITGGNVSGSGGGIQNTNGTVTVLQSSIAGNSVTAGGGGGGVFNNNGTLTITDSTFSGNSVNNPTGAGGGIYNNVGTLIISNSTLSGNSVTGFDYGGGIFNDGTATITNSTITLGSASAGGGGIRNHFGDTLTLQNTILSGNGSGGDLTSGGTVNDLGNNLIGGSALLDVLADNGGPTLTHALLPGSPAINAGDNGAAPATDQRGIARPQGAAADIGAYEVEPPADVDLPSSGSYTLRLNAGELQIIDDSTGTPVPDLLLYLEFAMTINGTSGDDMLTVDFGGGNPIPSDGLTFNGMSQAGGGDALALTGGGFTTVTYTATGKHDGSVDLDGSTITYTGLEPIVDDTTAADRVFTIDSTMNFGDHQVHLVDDDSAAGRSLIESFSEDQFTGFESVSFVSPTNSLTINSGDGYDMIWLESVDATFGASVIVNTERGNDQVSASFFTQGITANTGEGNDTVFATPFDDSIDGGEYDDYLVGDSGDDTILGGEDFDTIEGGDGDDSLDGGEDNDTIWGDDGDDTLQGGDGYDIVVGDEGDDLLLGGAHNDSLHGGDGNDTLDGEGGFDHVFGEADNDLLDGGARDDTLDGGDGDDTMSGGTGFDRMFGGTGADSMRGDAGNDSLDGEDGDDELAGDLGNDFLEGGTGADSLDGGDGFDFLDGGDDDDALAGGEHEDSLLGGNGNDALDGGNGDDYLNGQADDDMLAGGDGGDRLFGGGGMDALDGGEGDDRLNGNGGDDTLTGGAGDDHLKGGSENDVIAESADVDFALDAMQLTGLGTDRHKDVEAAQLTGGAGDNTLNASGFAGHVTLAGADGDDTLIGANGNDLLDGGAGDDNLAGAQGNDTLLGGDGNDALDGADGNDSIEGDADNDSLTGGGGDDFLNAGAGDDEATGDEGTDSLFGGAGVDTLKGGGGNDTVNGQGDADLLTGNEGDDRLVGGGGSDRVVEMADVDFTLADLELLGLGTDELAGVEEAELTGGAGDNTLDARNFTGQVTLWGGDGADTLIGGANADVLDGEDGDDRLNGQAGNDTLRGGNGDDGLAGGDGNDRLNGSSGSDTMLGGAGDDKLFGGGGDDIALGEDGVDTVDGQGSIDTVAGGGNGIAADVNDDVTGETIDDAFVFDAPWVNV